MHVKFRFPQYFFFALAIGLTSIIFYLPVFKGYFQQDEWLGYARYITLSHESLLSLAKYAFAPSAGRYNPLTLLGVFFLFKVFGLNYQAYVVVSLVLQMVVVFLVFYVALGIFKSRNAAIISALIFGVTAAGHQATSWVVADFGVHIATIFALISVLSFFSFIKSGVRKFLIGSVVFLLTSLLFKEIAVGLFIIYPVAILLFIERPERKRLLIKIFLGVAFFYLLFRGFLLLFAPQTQISSTVFDTTKPHIKFIYNLVTLPAKSLSQSLISELVVKDIAGRISSLLPDRLTGEKNTPSFEVFVIKRMMEGLTLSFSVIVLSICLLSFKTGRGYLRNIRVFSLAWILINSLVYAFSPERNEVMFLVDSRNLYFITVGSAFLITTFCLKTDITKLRKFGAIALCTIVLLKIHWLQKQLSNITAMGETRMRILHTIKTRYNDLPQRVVFYTESDSTFYGLPESDRIMPFQSGFGQTLLATYYENEKFPIDFYKDKYLWEIGDQGYKEVEERGFGYFRDFGLLVETLEKENLIPQAVISFRYDSESQILEDNTAEVRGRIIGFLVNKRNLFVSSGMVTASENEDQARLMLDGDRTTAWESKSPYAKKQEIVINLGKNIKIAEIDIDSYNDKNQNAVGYQVSISSDGNLWDEVFYSKKNPPDQTGVVRIYLPPMNTGYLKIKQIGYHEYAPWRINELELYEAI